MFTIMGLSDESYALEELLGLFGGGGTAVYVCEAVFSLFGLVMCGEVGSVVLTILDSIVPTPASDAMTSS